MYAITGITGQVGAPSRGRLLAADCPVRAVVRDAGKGAAGQERKCEVALANINDASALAAAFTGTEGVFVLIPPLFDPTSGFPEVRRIVAALRSALEAARPARVVCLSTIGAQVTQPNLLNQLGIMEQTLGELPMPVAFLRAAWFMENAAWDVGPARDDGVIPSFLQPLDRPVPMVATADIGRVGAELLQEIVERPAYHRAGRAAPRNADRYRGHLLRHSWPSCPRGSCPARHLGGLVRPLRV